MDIIEAAEMVADGLEENSGGVLIRHAVNALLAGKLLAESGAGFLVPSPGMIAHRESRGGCPESVRDWMRFLSDNERDEFLAAFAGMPPDIAAGVSACSIHRVNRLAASMRLAEADFVAARFGGSDELVAALAAVGRRRMYGGQRP